MSEKRYPYMEGDVIVIGPECFAARDGSVLSWRGRNYVPQPEPKVCTCREVDIDALEEAGQPIPLCPVHGRPR